MAVVYVAIDPRELRLPSSRMDGADPEKLTRQIFKYGKSVVGMPPILVQVGTDGQYVIWDGVTRATRVAKLLPGVQVTVQVIASVNTAGSRFPKVGSKP